MKLARLLAYSMYGAGTASTSLAASYSGFSSSLASSLPSPLPSSASWSPTPSPSPPSPTPPTSPLLSFSLPTRLILPVVESPAQSSPLSDGATITLTPSSTYDDPVPTYAPDPAGTTSREWRPSPVYTFLATLVLLLAVSAAIVTRSFILRRRNRRLIEEAIRNGTWNPGMMDGGVGGNGPLGRGGPRVDLSKKPVMWETYLGVDGSEGGITGYGDKGGYGLGGGGKGGNEGGGYGEEKGGGGVWNGGGYGHGEKGSAWGGEMKEWDGIKPVSVSYMAIPKGTSRKPVVAPLGIPPGVNDGHDHRQQEPRPGILSSAGTFVADLFRPPRSGAGPQANGMGAGREEDEEVEVALTPEGERTVRVAVLIAMPRPASVHRRGGSRSGSGSSSEASSSSLPSGSAVPPPITTLQTAVVHPLEGVLGVPLTQNQQEEDEAPLPVLEIGVAEVLVIDPEVEVRSRMSGDTEEEFRKDGDREGGSRSSVSVER